VLAEERAAADRIAADRAVRLSICERIENARADDLLSTLETGRAEWEGLPPSEAAAKASCKAGFTEWPVSDAAFRAES